MLITMVQLWDCDCMHNGGLGPPSPGLHRAGIRAILTLGDLSLAWALTSIPIKAIL
jgi:hypothetical protein